ncbi:MAG: prepilin-type N-terminal cleavage/methylation domain-containing protein [Nitrospina sp.]|jgi:prepilin-type N-terminal cleavage/methylation domain-containing protein|nr:prepilin-type N-terminal cleavage/methylation domain-containing protein [Nitrospina sp.]MBT5632052.1 prepilin-type N-terminal cleavage/methylation domain-containing protein [Nitrospina sp.]
METRNLPEKRGKGNRRLLESQDGFTLIEMLITLAIIGIAFTMSASNFSKWKDKHQINGQAQKVYFDLMLARTSAVKNNNDVLVTFSTVNDSYTVHDDTDGDGVEDASESSKSVNLEENAQFAFNTGISDIDGNAVSAAVSFGGSQTVTFDSRGQASASGSVFLLHANDIGITNARARTISVLKATGAVDYWTYDSTVTPPWS